MYEVEIKVELTDKERQALIAVFKERNFPFKGMTPQNDFYVEAVESLHGTCDIKRYRDEAGKFIYTEKISEIVENQVVRKESEHEVSKEKFDSALAQFPNALAIKKDREWFAGSYKGVDLSLTIDSVKFNHSPSMRYFIEAEIDVEDKNNVIEARNLIKDFLKDVLNKKEIIESPGMFMMAFKKL